MHAISKAMMQYVWYRLSVQAEVGITKRTIKPVALTTGTKVDTFAKLQSLRPNNTLTV